MKNGNALEMSAGQLLELTASVIRAMPKEMPPDVAQEWINNPIALKTALQKNLIPPPQPEEVSVAEMSKKFVLPVVFSLVVDYDAPLEVLIKRGKHDSRDDVDSFNIFRGGSKKGKIETHVSLVHFGEIMKFRDAENKLMKMGYRSANLRELLTFSYTYPDIQRQFPIRSLEMSNDNSISIQRVPVIWGSGIWRNLHMNDCNALWGEYCRFLAVPLS